MQRDELEARARAWVAGDPDPDTAAALSRMVEVGDVAALERHVGADLAFGTAGLRGEVGPGPNRMNRAVVVRATRGLADHLLARVDGAGDRGVVVGFDARPDSRRFAVDVVAVLLAAGLPVRWFTEPTATPLVAFAARHVGAAGAVVVTASHNPPADNGYKVYDEHGVQITAPTDRSIADAIREVGAARDVPGVGGPTDGADVLGADLFDDYRAAVAAQRPPPPPSGAGVRFVVTPMHGVGGAPIEAILADHGHEVVRVHDQWEPDGAFPTVDFPNPEEPGAPDLAIAAADQAGAAAILATDPDTDRLAVAIPDPVDGGWRRLSGDEVGGVFAHHLLSHATTDRGRPLVANSIVSSSRLGRIAQAFGARHEVTLTGFKWLWRAGRELEADGWRWVMGYEEALGYSLGSAVRDKDGINAAVVMADLVAGLAAEGRVLADLLGDLDDAHGRWANVQSSVRRTGPGGAEEILAAVDAAAVVSDDVLHADGAADGGLGRVVDDAAPVWRGSTPLVTWHLAGGGRVLVRPSGTEPKLKVYVDLPLEDGETGEVARALAERAVAALGIGG